MKLSEGMAIIEAVLFAFGEPMELNKIVESSKIDKETVLKLIDRLNDRYTELGSAVRINRLGTCYQMATLPEYAQYIKAAMETRRQIPLTQAAMEVLAIVAYNQPVTKSFIEQIRGVDSSGVVNSLVERSLLEESGRLNLPGRPIAYRTTDNFLRCFGLNDIDALPTLPESSEQTDYDEYEDMTYTDE